MHGLVNCAIQRFVQDAYGPEIWQQVARQADLPFPEFEAMLTYDDALTPRVLDAVASCLDRPRVDVMEDIGTYLVSHSNTEALRRLLRFGGVDFVDFLHSLDDLPERARLAVPDLVLPDLELYETGINEFRLQCQALVAGFGHVMIGVLRSLADDYGVLALLDLERTDGVSETITIHLIETDFSAGRSFELGAQSA
ncbi:MAG: heme NO-binding domain-containing protein [Pseudomonadota bacterium]